ncbi:MAG: Hsp20/alpha crystallin family protein [Sphingomonadaceae bacterium]|nr:Hsp20/alpha crystallin family protein [Sphingomonadaceae bacterium]
MSKNSKESAAVPVKRSEDFWRPLARVRSEFDHLFDDFWTRPMGLNLTRRIQALSGPALEFKDKGKEFELIAEIPGMTAEDVELKVSDGFLRLSGEKREEHEEKEEGYIFSERHYGRFERAVELPRGIDHEKISASARDGILSVHLPKNAAMIERERKIPINA